MGQRWTVGAADRVVEIDRNPENAELGNPCGMRLGIRYHLLASSDHGDTRYHASYFDTPEDALAYYTLLAGPVDGPEWSDGDPVYGSEAYTKAERAIVAAERRAALDYEEHCRSDWRG